VSRGPASNLMPQETAPSKTRISHSFRKNQENRRNKFQVKKPTEVAGRINSSNVRRAHSNLRSKVLRGATSSSSSALSPDSKAAAHEVQASSRVWASPLAAPCNKAAPVSSSAS
jgi:hypothetical protein